MPDNRLKWTRLFMFGFEYQKNSEKCTKKVWFFDINTLANCYWKYCFPYGFIVIDFLAISQSKQRSHINIMTRLVYEHSILHFCEIIYIYFLIYSDLFGLSFSRLIFLGRFGETRILSDTAIAEPSKWWSWTILKIYSNDFRFFDFHLCFYRIRVIIRGLVVGNRGFPMVTLCNFVYVPSKRPQNERLGEGWLQ